MIEYLRLTEMGVIRDAELDLAGGLTVLTGETGAGKTLILSGLDLLLGGKQQPGLASGDGARAEGIWHLESGHAALRRVAAAGGCVEGGELVINRTTPASGRGRCAAGGVALPVGVLDEIGESLVAVHGQSNQLLLRRPAAQRELLDAFGGESVAALAARFRQSFDEVVDLDEQLSASQTRAASAAAEMQELREALKAIEVTDPLPGEDEQLRSTIERLSRVQEFQSALHGALSVLAIADDDSPNVQTLLDYARRSVDSVAQADPELGKLQDRIIELRLLAQDLSADLSRCLDGLESDPNSLEAAGQRLAAITELTRHHGPAINDVLAWSQAASTRLLELEDQADVVGLRRRRDKARGELGEAAQALHAARVVAAVELSKAITTELRMLALPRASFEVAVTSRPPVAGQEPLEIGSQRQLVGFGPTGIDDVQLLLAAHPGAMAAPIAKAASGGELSRVMLAIEVVLAADSQIGTYVFDEVDAGIGGKAALEVGRRLALLAQRAQVIVVTHLAQVAAFADDHLLVEKSSSGAVTTASVRHVRGADRVKEVARMLSGHDESRHALDHATELLRIAAAERS